MGQPGIFLFIFGLFQTNTNILTTNQCEKCHLHQIYGAGIRTDDLYPNDKSFRPKTVEYLSTSLIPSKCNAKPQVSLTAPNGDHFARVSLMVLDNFFGCNRQS